MDRIKQLVKEKLCKKGEAYRKRRMAAGEKSSAYLSGRAVKVCKGQMSGKKKKKTNENKLISPSEVIALNSKRSKAVAEAVAKEFGIKEELRLEGVIRKALSDFMFDDMNEQKKKDDEDGNKVPGAALILPRGKEVILQAEEQDYKRGLLVTLLDSGGYRIKYWYGDDVKVYPAEVEVDGKSIKKDARVVDILFHPELREAFDELDDGYDQEMEDLIKAGPRLNKDRFKDVIYYIHNNWMAGNYGDDYAIRRISKYLNALEENVAPNHDGKAAPYGSGYKKISDAVDESLRDWFKKEDWVRINTSGNITGPCGTMKKGKATTRCLPRKKAQSLTKAERKASVAKKVRGSKKGKQFVKNTKKSEYKKKK